MTVYLLTYAEADIYKIRIYFLCSCCAWNNFNTTPSQLLGSISLILFVEISAVLLIKETFHPFAPYVVRLITRPRDLFNISISFNIFTYLQYLHISSHIFTYLHISSHIFTYLHHIFTISSPYLHHIFHHIFTISSPYLHHIFTISSPYLHHIFTISSRISSPYLHRYLHHTFTIHL